ncbi:MAG TPA: FAD-dependent monooxygenase [Actinopolymorphaceae bacterium]
MRALISGASIAGPVLAYWLARYGFTVTVVERAPALRKAGGHAVDLFQPAMAISERMGVAHTIDARSTGTRRLVMFWPGAKRPVSVDLTKVTQAASDRHVEIMRDDLSEIYYDASRNDVEYVFGDSITAISDGGQVSFEGMPSRRFDVVIGADGLHSTVRRLVFGEEHRFTRFLGAYVAVVSVPRTLSRAGEFRGHLDVDRLAGVYTTRHLDDARALFMFRHEQALEYHYRDVARQQQLLRKAFQGMHPEVDRWLAELDRTPAFYFDSITQLRMDSWSRGRVALVGDAGYCPGPAVGGSTSLAVVGAYVLAGELASARGDYERAFAAYERKMAENVRRCRSFAVRSARKLLPRSRPGIWAAVHATRLITALPPRWGRLLLNASAGVRTLDTMAVANYPAAEAQPEPATPARHQESP